MSLYYISAWLWCVLVAPIHMLPEGRITGGTEAAEGQFPYQVSLRKYGKHYCGGAIISPNYVLTAAHCVIRKKETGAFSERTPAEIEIRAGSIDCTRGGVLAQVAAIKIHPHYRLHSNDVALLQLTRPLTFSQTIQPIRLTAVPPPVGADIVVSGWGRLNTGGIRPAKLQWIILNSMPRRQCERRLTNLPKKLLCMRQRLSSEGYGLCNGDSGSPAVHNGRLVGVANFIVNACDSKEPDGFANVFYYLGWIEKYSDVKRSFHVRSYYG